MADTAVAITAGTGTNIDTRTDATNGNHRQVIVLGDPATNAGVAPVDATNGLAVQIIPALPAGTNNIGDVDVLTVPADPFGANADAASTAGGTGSLSAKARLMTTQLDTINTSITDGTVATGTAGTPSTDVVTVQGAASMTAVKVEPPVRYVTMTMTTPTGAQTAGWVIAATQAIAACTSANDAPGMLHSACLIDTDDVGVNIKAVFFSANTSLGVEGAAPDIDDTEALTVLGIVDFAAADFVDLGLSKYNTKTNIGLAVAAASGTDVFYMALYSPTGGTWASGVITVRLGFI